MLKKAGIIVGIAAASVLAVSPLAFAGDKHDGGHHGNRGSSPEQVNSVDNERNSSQNGLVNVGDVNALNDVNVCPGITAAVGVGNLLGILGGGVADTDAAGDDVTCVNDDSIEQSNDD